MVLLPRDCKLSREVHFLVYSQDAALITNVAFDHIYGEETNPEAQNATSNGSNRGLSEDAMGCLLLHHIQQMPCNIHAVTALISIKAEGGVWSKEQRRIAAGIYPTASLMNHACDPDVIVRYGRRSLNYAGWIN